MTTTATASPTKLQNGTWGAKTSSDVRVGDLITITTRAGKSWDAVVDRILWTGDGIAICATASAGTHVARSDRWTGPSCGACNKAKYGGYYKQHLFDGCEECGEEAG